MQDLKAVREQQQRTWATGDFAMIAWNTVFPCEPMCEAVDLRAGQTVLDVATGSGNAALSAARRGCDALGIDYVPALVDKARERAALERLPAPFEVGDCEAIPCADHAFDVVLSVFGSMFAPDPQEAAAELLRVCRPGGRIGMANWTPDGFWGQTFALQWRYLPPPVTLRAPSEWGVEARLRVVRCCCHFDAGYEAQRLVPIQEQQTLDRGLQHLLGPIIRALETLVGERRQAYLKELDDTLNRFNRSGDDTLMVSADYVEVVMVVR